MKPKSAITPSSPELIKKFSKARTIAARLGLCPRTIFRWADAGKITRHKINSRVVLFDEAEVSALIDSARIRFNYDCSHPWSIPAPLTIR